MKLISHYLMRVGNGILELFWFSGYFLPRLLFSPNSSVDCYLAYITIFLRKEKHLFYVWIGVALYRLGCKVFYVQGSVLVAWDRRVLCRCCT
jgi:hypothetical protein